jgi:hypothetical protein
VTAIDALPFEQIWLHDFEFVSGSGERPDVVCLAAHELRSGQTLALWRDELGAAPPYRIDRNVLFVSFVANAECACHLALGWPLPANVLDLNPAFRNLTNGLPTPEGKGLIGALRYFGLPSIGSKQKEAMQKRVIAGWPFTPDERRQILDYCVADAMALRQLLFAMVPKLDLATALYHGEFATVSALMEHNGVPIDMEVFAQLADTHTWRAVRDAMVPMIDARYGVYVRNAAGDWTFNMGRFAAYLEREGIAWPLLETGKLNMRRKVFEEMSKGWPQLEDLRQLRYARDKMRKVKLAVGRDGHNRTVLWIFSPAVWLRSLIKPGPGMAVAYIDYSAMEFQIAASLSDKHCGAVNNMLDMYNSGDPYLAFTKRIGAVPRSATKKSHADVRDKYKTMLLAVQYGMATETLAARLGVPSFEAQQMLGQHREVFAQYWRWSDDWVQHALQAGTMRTVLGWTCTVGITEFNERSIRNWPVQAHGAEILRVACIMAARRGIKLLAPVHDAVLIEAPIDQIEADVAKMQDIMRRAARTVLGGHELRTEANIIRHPERYSDKRGVAIWARVLELLAEQQRKTA